MLPPESTPHEPAPESTYRYNLEVAYPPNKHQRYLPGIVSLSQVSGKEDAVTLAQNAEKLEHYWLKVMTITNDSRKLYYRPQGSTCSNLFSFEVSLVDASTEKASEALIPVPPTVQIGKRLGLPTKGYFYHFHNKKLIQGFQIQEVTKPFFTFFFVLQDFLKKDFLCPLPLYSIKHNILKHLSCKTKQCISKLLSIN